MFTNKMIAAIFSRLDSLESAVALLSSHEKEQSTTISSTTGKPTNNRLPEGILGLQDFFPTQPLIGGSYARFVESMQIGITTFPRGAAYNDIDIFLFADITRTGLEQVIKFCFPDAILELPPEDTNRRDEQYKMDSIKRIVEFSNKGQAYQIVVLQPIHNKIEWFMAQQASELSQICLVPNYSDLGYSIHKSCELERCGREIHIKTSKCTDAFRLKLREQARQLGFKVVQ